MDDETQEDCNCPPVGAPAWMATFGDMMSLLVTFFVLLLSFANMDVVKFKRAMGSMKDALGVETEFIGDFDAKSSSPVELSNRQSSPMIDVTKMPTRADTSMMNQRMMSEVQKMIAANGMTKMVEAHSGERGVVISVKGQMLYEGGSDELHPEAFIFLDEIAELARDFPYHMSIEGHTDDIPISTDRFPSNWHLSSARAIAALRYMVEAGGIDRERLSASGYSDTRPVVPNDSQANRVQNRRVEFVYLRDSRLATRPEVETE